MIELNILQKEALAYALKSEWLYVYALKSEWLYVQLGKKQRWRTTYFVLLSLLP